MEPAPNPRLGAARLAISRGRRRGGERDLPRAPRRGPAAHPKGHNMQIRDLWYKNAVIYALDVEAFQDSNGDGIGDFEGLTQRLAYLAGLGVSCIWLHPFYASPRRD